MRVVQIPLTYPHHYERLLAFTMFPAGNTLHLTQFSPHLTVHHKHHLDQCADVYLLAQQTTAFQTALQHAQTAQMMMKKKISRWYPWMMNTGLLKKFMYPQTWTTAWIMPVSMSLCELYHYFIHGQFGFK